MPEKNKTEKNALYIVATPIGNLSDLSERAIKVLSEVDFIAAEDTRNTGKLLHILGVKKPLISYFEHNKRERGEEILSRMGDSRSCALVTDAGMPGISDPGEDLVKLCHERGIKVIPIPGACSAICGLAVSGLATGRFTFEGFLAVSKSKRREHLESLKHETRTMIFYEAPHKLRRTLDDMLAVLGDRKITLCRELTKLNEEICPTTLVQATEKYKVTIPVGEFVLVLEGCRRGDSQSPVMSEQSESAPVKERYEQLTELGYNKMEAVKLIAKERGIPKNVVYKECVIKNSGSE